MPSAAPRAAPTPTRGRSSTSPGIRLDCPPAGSAPRGLTHRAARRLLGELGLLGEAEAARLDAAAGQAGAREGAWGLAAGTLGSGLAGERRAGGRRGLGAEDLLL